MENLTTRNCPYIVPQGATVLAYLNDVEVVAYRDSDGKDHLRIKEQHIALTPEHHHPTQCVINLAHLGYRAQKQAIANLMALR